MFKMLVTGDKHQHFKPSISETTSIRLEYSSRSAEMSFFSKFKIDDYFFKLGYDVFSCVVVYGSSTSHHSIV